MLASRRRTGRFVRGLRPERSTERAGIRLSYRAWGRGSEAIILIHGRGGNAHWFDHLAPRLVRLGRVIAVDLAGHGDSGWLPDYVFDSWALDVAAIAEAEGLGRLLIVGQSAGSSVAIEAARLLPGSVGIVLIDPPIGIPISDAGASPSRPSRVFRTRREALRHFRAIPGDPAIRPRLERRIGRHSIRRVGDGWVWKSDPVARTSVLRTFDELEPLGLPLLVIRADRGMATSKSARQIASRLGGPFRESVVANSGHHIALCRPEELISQVTDFADEFLLRRREAMVNSPEPVHWHDHGPEHIDVEND